MYKRVVSYCYIYPYAFLLSSCSALYVEDIMIPIDHGDWVETKSESKQACIGFFSNNNPEIKTQFQCGSFQYTVNHITLGNFAMLGPPLVPLVPLPVPDQNSLSLSFNHTNDEGVVTKWETCPIPTIHSPQNIEILKTEIGGPYIYNCRYTLKRDENIPKELIISFKMKDGSCETDKLHFRSFTKKEYCMFFPPMR